MNNTDFSNSLVAAEPITNPLKGDVYVCGCLLPGRNDVCQTNLCTQAYIFWAWNYYQTELYNPRKGRNFEEGFLNSISRGYWKNVQPSFCSILKHFIILKRKIWKDYKMTKSSSLIYCVLSSVCQLGETLPLLKYFSTQNFLCLDFCNCFFPSVSGMRVVTGQNSYSLLQVLLKIHLCC